MVVKYKVINNNYNIFKTLEKSGGFTQIMDSPPFHFRRGKALFGGIRSSTLN